LNYRHIYHAGNFAYVFKYIIVARIIDYLKRKPQSFRVIDTNAGTGLYDLTGREADKTGDWKNGVTRFLMISFFGNIHLALPRGLMLSESSIHRGQLLRYPVSPLSLSATSCANRTG